MIPPIFHIGDEVEVTGPDRYGNDTEKKTLTICMLWLDEGKTFYSDRYSPWYPASSLRLVNEKPLLPMHITYNYKPDDCEHGTFQVSCPCGRKVEIDPKLGEELKIGDWVQHDDIIFQIADISDGEPYYLHRSGKTFEKWYHPSALRKLTPAGALCHITKRHSEYIDASLEALKGRISAIEKQLKEQQEKINQFDGEISHLMGSIQECLMESGDVEARARCREMAIEKRLDFVEQFQREQDDLVNRAIRDGVVKIFDFRRKP